MFWSANLTVCTCGNITNAFTIPSSPQFLDQVCTFRVPIATESSAAADHFHRAPHATRQTMSFAVSASATRVVASARAPVKAQRASAAAAFAAPASKTNSAARLSMRSVADAVALRADKSVAARAGSRGNLAVCAGRFETERTYIMIKPDGVQRGYVSAHPRPSCSGTVHRSEHLPLPGYPPIPPARAPPFPPPETPAAR